MSSLFLSASGLMILIFLLGARLKIVGLGLSFSLERLGASASSSSLSSARFSFFSIFLICFRRTLPY